VQLPSGGYQRSTKKSAEVVYHIDKPRAFTQLGGLTEMREHA